MMEISIVLTVYIDSGFWYGLFEEEYQETYRVCRVTFGKEPKDEDILDFLNHRFLFLQFSQELETKKRLKIKNPKRLQREARKSLRAGVSSKSQELLRLQYEDKKRVKKRLTSTQKQCMKQEKFEQKQQKRREKHKGH